MADSKTELKHRLEARKKELEAELDRMKADAVQSSNEKKQEVEKRLERIQGELKHSWNNFTEQAAERVNRLLRNDAA